jgi:cytochrome c oxidase subunit IV
MSADTHTQADAESARLAAHPESTPIPKEALDAATHDYPADIRYWVIALILGLITAVEVSTYSYPDFWKSVLVPTLLVLMCVKFWTVTFFFMHLRFDKTFLTVVFYAGLGLAVAVYLVMLSAFGAFAAEDDPLGLVLKVFIIAMISVVVILGFHFAVRRRDTAAGTAH